LDVSFKENVNEMKNLIGEFINKFSVRDSIEEDIR